MLDGNHAYFSSRSLRRAQIEGTVLSAFSEVLAPGDCPQLVLLHSRTPVSTLIRDVWSRRDLWITLARKDFFVRYRRATFGILWAVALPAVQAVVLAVILSRVARISVPHYSAFIFSGIVGWTYVAGTVGAGASSIVDNSALSSRIYFPRAILPLALCASNGFALVVSACIALIVGWSSGAGLGVHNFLLIPAVVLIVVFACGLTLLLSAVHVYFRDTVFFVQALLLIWFYATPVFYPLSLLHGAVHTIILINPLTGAVGLFHAAVIGGGVNIAACALTIGWTLGLLVVAAFLHSKYDRSFADLL